MIEIVGSIFLNGCTLLFALSFFNGWLLLLLLAGMVIIASRFYQSNITSSRQMNQGLIQQVQALELQLDYASREEKKASAEAARTAAARERLLTAVSREIRTPMNGIMGMAFLMQETDLNNEQMDCLNTIIESGKMLLNKVDEVMVADALEYSKVHGTNLPPQLRPLDLRNCIEEVLDTFAVKAAESKLELLYEIAPDVPATVMGNTRLQQLLINLVENVISTTEKQQVFIGVHAVINEETNIPLLAIEVSDRRLGDALEINSLLATAKPLNDYLKRTVDGDSALWLGVSQKIIMEIGGEIKAVCRETVPGVNFIFSMPCVPATTLMKATCNGGQGTEGQRVLIVNHNVIAAGILKNQLEQWKFISSVAFSAKAALEILSKESFCLVITVMDMPDMDAVELLKSIRVNYPALPILLLKALNDDRYKEHEEIFGEIALLDKPLKQHVFYDTVHSTIRHAKLANNKGTISIRNLSPDFAKQYPLRILVAEDNLVNQKWAAKILNKMGYDPAIASNGHTALDMVSQETYDLILMDVQMPEMDGMDATRMIRTCLDKQPIIIAMTANVMNGDRLACMNAGMDDYMSKPVELDALINMLEKWALVIRERKLVH